MKIGSSTASIPNPTPLLFLIAATAILLWPDASGVTAFLVGAAVAVPIAVFWVSYSAVGAIVALIIGSAVPRLYVEIAGLKARPEHVICGILCISILFLRKKRSQPIQWIWPDYLLMAYAALNLFSSLFMSIEPRQTIKWAAAASSGYSCLLFSPCLNTRSGWFAQGVHGIVGGWCCDSGIRNHLFLFQSSFWNRIWDDDWSIRR